MVNLLLLLSFLTSFSSSLLLRSYNATVNSTIFLVTYDDHHNEYNLVSSNSNITWNKASEYCNLLFGNSHNLASISSNYQTNLTKSLLVNI